MNYSANFHPLYNDNTADTHSITGNYTGVHCVSFTFSKSASNTFSRSITTRTVHTVDTQLITNGDKILRYLKYFIHMQREAISIT